MISCTLLLAGSVFTSHDELYLVLAGSVFTSHDKLYLSTSRICVYIA